MRKLHLLLLVLRSEGASLLRRVVPAGLCLLLGAVADAQTYDLTRSPTFKVGDRIEVTIEQLSSMTVQTADGKVVILNRQQADGRFDDEVTGVDPKGQADRIRRTLVQLDLSLKAKRGPGEPDTARTTVKAVSGNAKRDNHLFVADTASLISSEQEELDARQIMAVKGKFDKTMHLGRREEADALLFAKADAAVGAGWDLSPETLARWHKQSSLYQRNHGEVTSGHARLVSAKDNIGQVEVTLNVTVQLPGMPIALGALANMKVTLELDSGRWLAVERSVLGRKTFPDKSVVELRAQEKTTLRHVPGKGKAAKLPEKFHQVGWPSPEEDSNSYKNPEKGFSLGVPKSYKAMEGSRANLAQFATPGGGQLAVRQTPTRMPAIRAELIPTIIRDLKAGVPEYTLLAREKLLLPGGYPAELLKASCYKGALMMITFVALDTGGILHLTAAAPIKDEKLIDELAAVCKTLRLFERTPPKPPSR